jgi:hypothetical protein
MHDGFEQGFQELLVTHMSFQDFTLLLCCLSRIEKHLKNQPARTGSAGLSKISRLKFKNLKN